MDIDDTLLQAAKKLAAKERTSLRSLVNESLSKTLEDRAMRHKRFKLSPIKFGGGGFQPEFRDTDGTHLRNEVYRSRGT